MSEFEDDIEKYLSGKLTNAERHQLEKKALSDPFLAEALDGAGSVTSTEFSHDLNEIHQKINLQKRNSFFWPLRIAAGIIVIISITIVTINLTESDTDNQLALQKQNPSTENLPLPKKAIVDPAMEAPSPKVEQQVPAARSNGNLPAQPAISQQPTTIGETMQTADALSSTSIQSEQNQRESEMIEDRSNDKIEAQKTELSSAKEVDEKMEVTQSRAASAPSSVRSLPLNKKSAAASGASMAKDDAPSTVVLSESSISPMPDGGITQFNKYVEDNLRYPQRALTNNIEGDVIVEFQIDANGSYRNFKIIKSVGYGCDEEAIRLIKEGPKWSPTVQDGKVIDTKPRVSIPFILKR